MSPYSPFIPLKLLACLLLTAIAIQPVLAGQYFVGHPSALELHSQLGELVAWLALAQAGLAGICRWSGRLRRAPTLVFVGIFGLAGLQVHAGHNGYLALHIPLGSFILAISTLTTIWLLRQREPDNRRNLSNI